MILHLYLIQSTEDSQGYCCYTNLHQKHQISKTLTTLNITKMNIENIDNIEHWENNNHIWDCLHIMLSKFGAELKSAVIVVEDNGEDYVGHHSKKDGERQNPSL